MFLALSGVLFGLVLGALCCWLMMGCLWKLLGGGLWGWARVADFALSGVVATCPFTIYHLLVNVLRFLVSGFYIYYVVLYILV